MIRYIYANDLNDFPRLKRTMFQDRTDQFKARLGWDVKIDESGEERDEYDALNPLYVIWEKTRWNPRGIDAAAANNRIVHGERSFP